MGVKVLLVPVFGDKSDRPALDAALPLARRFAAHVSVLHVERDPASDLLMVGDPLSASAAESIIEAAEADIKTRAKQARATFEAWMKASKLTHTGQPGTSKAATATWTQMQGAVETIARRGRLADIVILARGSSEDDERRSLAIETALTRSGRPVLLAASKAPKAIGKTVAIAWNGSAEAARAVAQSLPLLAEASKIVVLTAPEKGNMGEDAEDLARSLAWHGLTAEVRKFSAAGDIGANVLAAAGKAGADLLVMGAYSHSRLRELVLGGVTRRVLKAAKLPVLMVH
ncbi:MAG: universal stress protein [Proteobacteria bacterium]|nr:universal stress protein [Pseudomonadota bacterium]MBI3497111.1 universal stress protein [Pseudomonadota bacterium]